MRGGGDTRVVGVEDCRASFWKSTDKAELLLGDGFDASEFRDVSEANVQDDTDFRLGDRREFCNFATAIHCHFED
jgi:hypothetical protein